MDEENVKLFQEAYDKYRIDCESALDIAVAKINSANKSVKKTEGRGLFLSISARIKEFESVLEKCHLRGYDTTEESMQQNIRDFVGIRIVTLTPSDIYRARDNLARIPGVNIVEEKDYVKHPKSNGYSSYHVITMVEVYSCITNGTRLIPVEIQIRDKGMDYWATLEHEVKYKKGLASPEVEEIFREVATIVADLGIKADQLLKKRREENDI